MAGRRVMVGSSLVLVLALVGGVAWYLSTTQTAAAQRLRRDFAQRARLAADLTAGAIASSAAQDRDYARAQFSGPERTIQSAVEADAATLGPNSLVLTLDGRVLGEAPRAPGDEAFRRAVRPLVAQALATGHLAVGNLISSSRLALLPMAIGFPSAHGQRVWATSAHADSLATFARAYLSSAPEVGGGRAFLVDAGGRLVGSSGNDVPGGPLPDPGVYRALPSSTYGQVGAEYFASAPVTGTTWRVVFVAPSASLLAPIQSTRRVAWQVFGAFVAAMICLVLLGAATLQRSDRLAHERSHDALTGLPNRAVFMDRTRRALSDRPRRPDRVAALFIDLDGFKPINDVHGHAVGDALLAAVAGRLTEAVRPVDLVSRFGGDEFLVLCTDLERDEEAIEIANRIQERLCAPFEVERQALTVGCSIGIATYDDGMADAADLIHNADLAMYRAKQGGRGRIECFDATTTVCPADAG